MVKLSIILLIIVACNDIKEDKINNKSMHLPYNSDPCNNIIYAFDCIQSTYNCIWEQSDSTHSYDGHCVKANSNEILK